MSSLPPNTLSPTGLPNGVEGQRIASAVVAAVVAGQPHDWGPFHETYDTPLRRCAAAHVARLHLNPPHDAEDIFQGFLSQRIYPPDRALAMFGRTGAGLRPLLPMLLASLRNYCLDLVPSAEIRSGQSERLEQTPARTQPADCRFDREELEGYFARQLEAVRRVLPLDARRGVVLYRMRQDVLPLFQYHADLAELERCCPWTAEENELRFTADSRTLERLWEGLRLRLQAEGQLPARVISQQVPTRTATWGQWFHRGTLLLQAGLGQERYAAVFPLWAPRQEDRR